MNRSMNSRACAAKAVFEVLEQGVSLSESLASAQQLCANPKDKGLVAELSYGVLRWLPQLDYRLQQKLQKPLKGKKRIIHHLLLVGLYQLLNTRIPGHAAVSETVNASKELGGKGLSGVVNGILRGVQREIEDNAAEIDWPSNTLKFAHPKWLIQSLQADYPDKWQQILEQNSQHPPMWLRVNQREISRANYLKELANSDIEAVASESGPDAILLTSACDVRKLPGFEQGWFAVQDLAAQQAAHLLPNQANLKGLDICAAPGGKTCHWQEVADNKLDLLAIDIEPKRLLRVEENLKRLKLNARVLAADASTKEWWDGKPFNAILLDAPCSATGVIRRHPDIKWLRQRNDITELVKVQKQILENTWAMLAPGGSLLYATCSVLKLENQLQISDFLLNHSDAELVPIHEGESEQAPGWQILPGEQQMDGFYYARLKKRA